MLVLVLCVRVLCSLSLLPPPAIVCVVGNDRSGRLTRAGDLGTNKWYQTHTSAVVGLTVGDDGWFRDGRQQQRCYGCPATTAGRRAHGAEGQRL